MNQLDTGVHGRPSRMRIPRSRGAASGFVLILLGAWGALIPFVGPYFHFAYTPDQVWTWTAARGWLEVLPGAATALGGLLMLGSRHRASAMLGGWLAVLAGAWFVVGTAFAGPLRIGDIGSPLASTDTKRALLEIAFFYGLGAVIIFLGAVALGRLSVRSLRDIGYAQRPVAVAEPKPGPVAESAAESNAPRTESTAATDEPPRRPWDGLFRRRHSATPAHR
jgi:hypothetical protein